MNIRLVRILICVLAGCACLFAAAGDLPFRSGRIVGAELSTRTVRVPDAERIALPSNAANAVCAVLTVELTPGRLLSIYDYKLTRNGHEYAASALRIGDGDFSFQKYDLSNAKPGERYSLLFFVDSGVVYGNTVNFQLTANFPPKDKGVSVPFENLGGNAFTSPSSFSKKGDLK